MNCNIEQHLNNDSICLRLALELCSGEINLCEAFDETSYASELSEILDLDGRDLIMEASGLLKSIFAFAKEKGINMGPEKNKAATRIESVSLHEEKWLWNPGNGQQHTILCTHGANGVRVTLMTPCGMGGRSFLVKDNFSEDIALSYFMEKTGLREPDARACLEFMVDQEIIESYF